MQPIQIEKPFQSLLKFSHSAGEKIFFRVICCHFFSVYFLNALQNDNNICFYFDALFLFTRETISFLISDCLSRYPAWSFLVWFKRRTTIRDGVSTLYAWIFRCFEARVAHILFRNHCVAFPLRCHFVLHFCVCAHALSEWRGLLGSVGRKNWLY